MINYDERCNPVDAYLGNLTTVGSRRVMRQSLNTVAKYLSGNECDEDSLEWHRLRYSHTSKVRTWLAETYKPASANRHLGALRGVLKTCWRLGMMENGDYQSATSFTRIIGNGERRGRIIENWEIAKLLEVCLTDGSRMGLRDHAIITLMYATGIRRGELIHVKVEDYDRDEKALRIRKGKYRKERTLFLSQSIADSIETWLTVHPFGKSSALFLRTLRGDNLVDSGMTDQAIYSILVSRAKQAEISEIQPHDFRRTFISGLIDKGVDLVTVSRLAGHEKIDSTITYDRRSDTPLRKAAELISLPTT